MACTGRLGLKDEGYEIYMTINLVHPCVILAPSGGDILITRGVSPGVTETSLIRFGTYFCMVSKNRNKTKELKTEENKQTGIDLTWTRQNQTSIRNANFFQKY